MFDASGSLKHRLFLGMLCSLELFALSSKLLGDFIATPGNASIEGDSNSNLPFSVALYSFSNMRYQQVYGSPDFMMQSGPGLITAISFRPDSTFGNAFAETLTNIQISLSTTQAQPDGLSAIFADNVGPDSTLVHNGSLALSSAFSGPVGGPKDFDVTINFSTPFFYDPSLGNLLLDVRSFAGGSIRPFDAFFVANDSVSRVMTFIGQNANSTSGNVVDTLGLATRFTLLAIPEPSALSLTALSAIMMIERRRRSEPKRSN